MTDLSKVSAAKVANFFIENSNFSYSPLKIQKLIYIANLLHANVFGKNFIKESFQAWDYGPVIPSLYHELKKYGASPITTPVSDNGPELTPAQVSLLHNVDEIFGKLSAYVLVSATHREGGAWDKNYAISRYKDIPEEDIIEEAKTAFQRN